jgi:hypothetical protein
MALVINYDPNTYKFISAKVMPHGGGNKDGVLTIWVAEVWWGTDGSWKRRQYVTSTIIIGLGGGGSCKCPENVYPDYGEEEEKVIVTDVSWDEAYCKLVIKRAKIKLSGGHIVAWNDHDDKDITTISHSDVTGA